MAAKGVFVDFKRIKSEVSIVRVLEHYGLMGRLRRSGDSLSGPCPIHQGDNKTAFRVSVSKNCFNCFGECKGGGNVLDFVARYERVSVRDSALLIQKWFGVDSPQAGQPAEDARRDPSPAEGKDEAKPSASRSDGLDSAENEEAEGNGITKNPPLEFLLRLKADHPYLRERGITPETIETFGLGYCEKGLMAGRICIPIHDSDGRLVAYAGRWPGTPPKDKTRYKLPKGFRKSLEVFNLHRARQADPTAPLVVVEGFFGCMRVWQAGIRRVVSAIGSSMSEAQAASIAECAGTQGRVALLYDNDDAGIAGRDQAVKLLSPRAFVKATRIETEGAQPDQLSTEKILAMMR